MAVTELAGILPEEALRPRPCQEFHRHGMNLAALHAGPDVGGGDAVAVHIGGKGVTGFMRYNLNIMLGAVKVGKNKGNLIIGDAGAVATAAFAFGGENIQQFIV